MLKLTRLCRSLLIAIPVLFVAAAASAIPIQGQITLQAVLFPSVANEIDLGLNTVITSAMVTSATGDLSGLLGQIITIDFDYGSLPDVLWTADGFTFTGLSADIAEYDIPLVGVEAVVLTNGVGELSHAGFDTTAARWEFGATEVGDMFFALEFNSITEGIGGSGGGPGISAVPEPSASLLFALGLGAVGRSVRKRG